MNTPLITHNGFGFPDPELARSFERHALLSRGLDSNEWMHFTNVDPSDTGEFGGISYRGLITLAHDKYGPENVREIHDACDFNGRELPGYHALYVRKASLDTAREIDPSRAFETH